MNARDYFRKMKGTTKGSPPRVSTSEVLFSWLGAFLGIGTLVVCSQFFFNDKDSILLIGSFGASAVLIYGAIRSPLAQPRNLIGGHALSAIVGVIIWKLLHPYPGLAAATAVATAIAFMHLTRTLHPPGGATAMIAVIGSPDIHALGFYYVLMPATIGPAILLVIALLFNNIPKTRRYPEIWY